MERKILLVSFVEKEHFGSRVLDTKGPDLPNDLHDHVLAFLGQQRGIGFNKIKHHPVHEDPELRGDDEGTILEAENITKMIIDERVVKYKNLDTEVYLSMLLERHPWLKKEDIIFLPSDDNGNFYGVAERLKDFKL